MIALVREGVDAEGHLQVVPKPASGPPLLHLNRAKQKELRHFSYFVSKLTMSKRVPRAGRLR